MELLQAIKRAIALGLTIAEFAYLYFLFTNNNEGKELIFNRLRQPNKDKLKKRYIDEFGNLTEDGLGLFTEKGLDIEVLFEEFYQEFPNVATRQDGTVDVLKVHKTKCRQMYESIVKTKEMHEKMMLCLKAQIQWYTETNKMCFLRRMINWLNQEDWIIGESIISEIDNITKVKKQYGDEVR